MPTQAVLSHIDATLEESLERLFTLLRFESVSTDPVYHQECLDTAEWLRGELSGMGFAARVVPTSGKPVVIGKRMVEGAPHILFYGHYDVQPADPLEKWKTGPFEPRLEETKENGKVIRARGASDDKGQLMTFLEAARAHIAVNGGLPLSVTVMLEGEEETGSPSLPEFLEKHREEIAADAVLICDTSGLGKDLPSVTTQLRGLCTAEVKITGPSRDLHSGYYGGAVVNPNHVAAKLVAALHDDEGRVRIPGFYDGVEEVSQDLKTRWQALPFSEEKWLGEVGFETSHGEEGYNVLERTWARPTAEVNGIIGGYTGEGTKTVIPSEAIVKLSFRLVAGQDHRKILQNFQDYARSLMPPGASIEFSHLRGADAVQLDVTSPLFAKAEAALEAEYGHAPAFIGMGGSIPIVQSFKEELGMEALMVGFALEDDQIHSPNEKYNLSSYHRGTRSWARIIEALAQ